MTGHGGPPREPGADERAAAHEQEGPWRRTARVALRPAARPTPRQRAPQRALARVAPERQRREQREDRQQREQDAQRIRTLAFVMYSS
jgi:hypothetical protein